MLAGRRQLGRRTYACFIDVRKAYDRVWRDGLLKALWQKGVRGRAWRVVRSYYQNVKSCVRMESGDTDWFDIGVGVRQGCVLSPLLFNLFIDNMALEVKALGWASTMEAGSWQYYSMRTMWYCWQTRRKISKSFWTPWRRSLSGGGWR